MCTLTTRNSCLLGSLSQSDEIVNKNQANETTLCLERAGSRELYSIHHDAKVEKLFEGITSKNVLWLNTACNAEPIRLFQAKLHENRPPLTTRIEPALGNVNASMLPRAPPLTPHKGISWI